VRNAKRLALQQLTGSSAKAVSIDRLKESAPIHMPADTSILAVARGGWSGIRAPIIRKEYTLEELDGMGFEFVKWDGKCEIPSLITSTTSECIP
jgi:hypothetical protein